MTGWNDDDTPHSPPEPPEPPQAVLEGEVVVYGEPVYEHENPDNFDDNGRWKGYRKAGLLSEDDVEEVIRMRLRKVPYRIITQKYGISTNTIRRWVGEDFEKTQQRGTDVEKIRAAIAQEQRAVIDEAWKMYEAYDHPGVKKDALVRVESGLRNLATLYGANAPVRVKAEVEVTELTQEDLAIRDMINQAKAVAAGTKAKIEEEFRRPATNGGA